jgi:hypothetical protein
MLKQDNMQGEQAFPMAVFLDTNIIEELPETLESGELSSLIAEAREAEVKVYLPDIVAREWIWHRLERLLKNMADAKKGLDHVRKYFNDIPDFNPPEADNILDSVFRIAVKHIKDSGLRVLGPPKASIRRLTHRAAYKQIPFRSANRGFKDELVVLAILKLLKNWEYKSLVLISKDSDFSQNDLHDRFKDFGAKLIVARSIENARQLLSEKLNKAWQDYYARLRDEVREIADQKWIQISEAIVKEVEEHGVSEYGITWDFSGRKNLPTGSEAKRVVSIEPIKIDRIDVGTDDTETKMRPITILISTKFGLEVEEYTPRYDILFRHIRTEESERLPILGERKRVVRDITKNVTVEAAARRLEDNKWEAFKIIEVRT